jgi:dTDP-4-amino-4,6-dideoxygalactose transaminase
LNSFAVVEQFEQALAEFTGAPYAVTTNTGTSAIFLSLLCHRALSGAVGYGEILLPARTFISVPMAVRQAGMSVEFEDVEWGGVYQLKPWPIWDAALRFKRGMYSDGYTCLSFHARKTLNIGEGGAVLTANRDAAQWLKAARYCGRMPPFYRPEDVKMLGFQAYMTPEKAARGLHLMEYIGDGEDDQVMEYADLRQCEVFQ